MLPTVEEITKYGMLFENPLWKLKQYKKGKLDKVNAPIVRECTRCHLYTEDSMSLMCTNCGLKF